MNSSIAEDVIGEGFSLSMCRSSQRSSSLSSSATSLGLVPGFKTSTGAIFSTWALAVISVRVLQLLWHEDSWLLPVLQEPLPVGRSWSHSRSSVPRAFSMVIRVLTLPSDFMATCLLPHDVCHLQHRHHLLLSRPLFWFLWTSSPACLRSHGSPCFVVMYALRGAWLCFIQAFVFRDPVGFLCIHRGARALSPSRLASTAASLNRRPACAHA